MTIFICISNGQDPCAIEIWRAYTKEEDAKQWVKEIAEWDDKWNKCDFDEEFRKVYEKELILYGIVDKDGKYNDNHAGEPAYVETELYEIVGES